MYIRMPPYILVKNTAAGDVKATPYGSLEELRSWLESELGPACAVPAADNSELQTKIKSILETNLLGSSPLAAAIDALFSAPQENGDMSPEYRKNLKQMYEIFEVAFTTERNKNAVDEEYDLFNKHPEFEHYALLSSYSVGPLLPEHYEKDPTGAQIICDLRDKKLIYKVSPETCKHWGKYGRRFITTDYRNVVKALYDIYGTVMPKLAYMIVTSYFKYNGISLKYTKKCVFDSDQCETDKVWVDTFVDKFFVRGEGKAMKRSDFIDALNAHFDAFIKNYEKDYNTTMGFPATHKSNSAEYFQKWRAESELFKSPDKILGLRMVRRAAGMYIVGIAPEWLPVIESEPESEAENSTVHPHPVYTKVIEHYDQECVEWSSLTTHKIPFNQMKGYGIANVKFKGNWVSAQIHNGNSILNTVHNEHGLDSFYATSEGRCLPFTGNRIPEEILIRFQATGPCSFSYDIVSCDYDRPVIHTKDYYYTAYKDDDKIKINKHVDELWFEPNELINDITLVADEKQFMKSDQIKLMKSGQEAMLFKFKPNTKLDGVKILINTCTEKTRLNTFAKVRTVLEKGEVGWWD